MKYARRRRSPCSVASSYGCCSSCMETTVEKEKAKKRYKYYKLKTGVQKSVPAALILWPFYKIPSKQGKLLTDVANTLSTLDMFRGLTSRKIINFLRKHYYVPKTSKYAGKIVGGMLKAAVEFGLLVKKGKKFFIVDQK